MKTPESDAPKPEGAPSCLLNGYAVKIEQIQKAGAKHPDMHVRVQVNLKPDRRRRKDWPQWALLQGWITRMVGKTDEMVAEVTYATDGTPVQIDPLRNPGKKLQLTFKHNEDFPYPWILTKFEWITTLPSSPLGHSPVTSPDEIHTEPDGELQCNFCRFPISDHEQNK